MRNFRIEGSDATFTEGWQREALDAMKAARPTTLSFDGVWPEDPDFFAVAAYVRTLLVRAAQPHMRGVETFSNLERMVLGGRVRIEPDLGSLRSLRKLELRWSPGWWRALTGVDLNEFVVHGLGADDLALLAGSLRTSALTLISSKIEKLDEICSLGTLDSFTAARCSQLQDVRGLWQTKVKHVRFENVPKLVDMGFVRESQNLETISIVEPAAALDLSPLGKCESLRSIHVGGSRAPTLDWKAALALPNVEKIFGRWDPDYVSEDELRSIAVDSGSSVQEFEVNGSRGIRGLYVTLTRA
jgi:hypothetical protein